MGRLKADTLDQTAAYAERVLDAVDALDSQKRSARLLDHLFGSGASVAANAQKVDEAMTAGDSAERPGVCAKEPNETFFRLRLIAKRGWITRARPQPLIDESVQLRRIFGSMTVRTRRQLSSPAD